MKKSLFALTALMATTVISGTMAQNRFHGNDWDPPASHQWHNDHDRNWRDDRRDNGRHNGWEHREERRRMVYAPRRGAKVREYVYYPNARAYYAPWNKRWYYRNGNRWVVAQRAPININLGNGLTISLGADSPVTYDTYVVKNYRSYY